MQGFILYEPRAEQDNVLLHSVGVLHDKFELLFRLMLELMKDM